MTISGDIISCRKCGLHKTRTQAVPGVGPKNAKVVFIGEAPGANEDEKGEPFIGRSGKFLTALIEGAGLKRSEVFITNIVKCRPPDNRDPEPGEIKACRAFLDAQLSDIKPAVVVTLGRFSMGHFLSGTRISDVHGKVFKVRGKQTFRLIPMYHPAAALRNPALQKVMRKDFQKLAKFSSQKKQTAYDVILIDGRNLLYRALDSHFELTAPTPAGDEIRTGGIYGFLSSLVGLKKHYGGKSYVVVWEGRDNFRNKLYPAYKQHRRERTPEDEEFREILLGQEEILKRVLKFLGVPQYSGKECEADDVIGTLASIQAGAGKRVGIYSNDSDLRQLVDDMVNVISPAIREIRDTIFTPEQVTERYGFGPEYVADYKALAGDPSDNIPGVKGIGDKTATALIKQYGHVSDIIKAASNGHSNWPVAQRFIKSVADAEQDIGLYLKLTTIRRQVKLLFRRPTPDEDAFRKQLKRLRFRSLMASPSYDLLLSVGGLG